jgi:hypothetical protein
LNEILWPELWRVEKQASSSAISLTGISSTRAKITASQKRKTGSLSGPGNVNLFYPVFFAGYAREKGMQIGLVLEKIEMLPLVTKA